MQISNKLVTADFVELQKILMEDYKPSPSFIFTLKYVTNFLYGLVVFSAFYFILKRFAQIDNLLIPAITGLITFAVLVVRHPKIFERRMTRAIEKNYARADLTVERNLILDEDGLTIQDNKGEKSYEWTDFERIVRSMDNFFLRLKGGNEGFIIKADHLEKDQVAELEHFLAKTGLIVEEKSHGK